MKLGKQGIATIGLIFITFLAAIQYVFLANVPDTVSTFAFVCITNAIGLLVLGITQIKKIVRIRKTTLKKGVLFALELTGFNFFTLLGSRDLDAVIISSVVSLYFVFVTPLLLLLKKKVNFFSGIASVIAIIALLLMFGADMDALFSSPSVLYLIIGDVFFAAYVVSVSILGEGEDSLQLTFSQMAFAAVFGFMGWIFESLFAGGSLSLPGEVSFWVSALFIGVFIRAVYGILQIACQKQVSALKASLIFAAEIIITLITNPIMCSLFGMDYTPVTGFQVIGGILFIVATLMIDDGVMSRLGYEDMQGISFVKASGADVQRTSVARKIIVTTLTFSIVTLIVSTVICLSSIHFIRNSAVTNSQELGENASAVSSEAMIRQMEENISNQAADKMQLAEQKLAGYTDSALYAASYAHSLYEGRGAYPDKEVKPPLKENGGKWVMQRTIADKDISYESLREESGLLGNMVDVFEPIIANNANIATIYMGTESGLLISYDPYSDSGDQVGEGYYEYRDSTWYELGKRSDGCAFTETYQDSYGRGLTITCVAPFTNSAGKFCGCIAIDILMSEMNESMVNDGIVDPSVATLIDGNGNYIAGKNVDSAAEDMGSIFDEDKDAALRSVGERILEEKNGVLSTGEGDAAQYIAFSTIESVDWTLCIASPVSAVIKPAETIRGSIDENTDNVVNAVVRGIATVIQSCLVLSALVLIFVTLLIGKTSKRISDPLKRLEADVRRISEGNFEQRTQVSTDDEIGSLAESFNYMTDSIQRYIADLKEITAKEERIAGELSAATSIQASMLPTDFDAYAGYQEFCLYATMNPAKEVGGDFYDFFMVDERHLAIVMADVSGKGVPAALFMVIGKTLIKDHTQPGKDLGEVFTEVNKLLCESNSEGLFITAFEGVLDLVTGELRYVNAGHEIPYICRKDGKFEPYKIRAGFVLAGVESMKYKCGEVRLDVGDKLFQYTDGVTEATNAADELYGMDRLTATLGRYSDLAPNELLAKVKEDIDGFVGEAPQFDDITMLCVEYRARMER